MSAGAMHVSSSSFSSMAMVVVIMAFALLLPGCFCITSSEVKTICSTTLNPSFCVKSLNSNPRTPGADLKGVAQISIEMAKDSATKTNTLVASLVANASDSKLRGRYETCAENFDSSISSLRGCTKAVSSGDFKGLNFKASAALDGPETCLDSFEGPPKDPSQLPTKCHELINLCSIILALSKRLGT